METNILILVTDIGYHHYIKHFMESSYECYFTVCNIDY